jgi:hypothetical protein
MNVFRWTSTRGRLIAAGLVGFAVFCFSFTLDVGLRILLAYDLSVSTYLAFLAVRMANADGEATRDLAEKKETSNRLVLTLAGLLSITRIVVNHDTPFEMGVLADVRRIQRTARRNRTLFNPIRGIPHRNGKRDRTTILRGIEHIVAVTVKPSANTSKGAGNVTSNWGRSVTTRAAVWVRL